MNRKNSDIVKKLVSVFVLWCMAATGVFSMLAIQTGGADQAPEPFYVPAVIDEDFEIRDWGVYDADYSIRVTSGATLTIVNSTLNFLQDEVTDYFLDVSAASLVLENSTITTGATPQASWDPVFSIELQDSTLKMTDHSVLAFPGWLNVTNTRTYINDSWITSLDPDTYDLSSSWLNEFQTFYGVVNDWWTPTPYNIEDPDHDDWNDAPVMSFSNCGNVTIADSRIDELYEDAGMSPPTPESVTFSPLDVFIYINNGTSKSVVDQTLLHYPDYDYVDVSGDYSQENRQNLSIESFDVTEYPDSLFVVNSASVHAIYKTQTDVFTWYDGSDYLNWSFDGNDSVNQLFTLQSNSSMADDEMILSPPPTISQIANLNVWFNNTANRSDNTTYFDLIEINAEIVANYSSYPTQIKVNDTEMSIINSYVGVDWLSFETDIGAHNTFNLTGGSNLYLYNMSYSEDEGGTTGVADFLEIPDGDTRYELYTPFIVKNGSNVYNFKWLDAKVTDKYYQGVEGAYVNTSFKYPGQQQVNEIGRINNLSGDTDPDWTASKDRVISYMNRVYGVDATNFNITGSGGRVMLPLLTEFINSSIYPNGNHTGEYDVTIKYSGAAEYAGYEVVDFVPYPNNQPEDNLVSVESQLYELRLPRDSTMPGLIVNEDTGDITMSGAEGDYSDLAITDFIIVEDWATLTLNNYDLDMLYSGTAPFHITVRDTATLEMNMVKTNTQYNMPMTITVEDGASLIFTDTSIAQAMNIKAHDSTTVNLNRTVLGGDFDIVGTNPSVTLWAWDTKFSMAMDLGGTSEAHLVACYSPLSDGFVYPSDSAQARIYRWIEVTAYDGVTPKNTLENVAIAINYQNPNAEAAWNRNGFTDAEGVFLTFALSNILTPGGGNTAYTTYDLTYLYQPGTTVHADTQGGKGLKSYPDMKESDGTTKETIILENVLPDLDPPLTVWPIGDNNTVGRGDTIMINTTISNTGDATAKNINVWINDTFEGETETFYDKPIEILEPGEHKNISVEYSWPEVQDLGWHNVTVKVDPLNDIKEQDEDNNSNYTLVNITAQADLAIQNYYDVSFSQAYPVINEDFDIMANVWNLGDINATDVMVSFYEISTGTDILLGYDIIDSIPANPSVPGAASITVSFEENGNYTILAVIDGANEISEVDETNNNNSMWPRTIRVWEHAGLNIDQLDILIGTNPVEYGLGGGTSVENCYNRTTVTLRARVWNTGELFASNVIVEFQVGGSTVGSSSTVSTITSGDYKYMMITWNALTDGLSQVHNIRATAYATGLTSNTMSRDLTVRDDRPDLELDDVGLAGGPDELVDGEGFGLNVTVTNNGLRPASKVHVDVYASHDDFQNTTTLQDAGYNQYLGRLGNITIDVIGNGATVNQTISCGGLAEGVHDLFIVVDQDLNTTDTITILGAEHDIIGHIEEYDESNNQMTLYDVTVVMPELMVRLVAPAPGGNSWKPGETNEILVAGNVVRADNTNIGVSGIEITVDIEGVGEPVTLTTDQGGSFTIGMSAPEEPGNYTVTVTGQGVSAGAGWFVIQEPGFNFLFWIIIIILVIVAVIVGITLYLYFVGLGKTVQCGECSAFIPEGAKKCPRCGVEFEDEVAKCSICGAWVPIDVKNCPECGTEFTVGTEELDDYEAKMRRQYDDIVRKFKEEAKGELGEEFTETEFQAWWAKQPTFITFDQWLQEEEEMKRMGSRPCPECNTENSVTAKICHKCGTVMGPEEEAPKPKGKMPVEEKEAAEQPEKEAAAPLPTGKEPEKSSEEKAGDKKKCPSCGMEVNAAEETCPICSYEFGKGEKPPEGGDEAPRKRVVKKPVRRVVKKPVKGGEE